MTGATRAAALGNAPRSVAVVGAGMAGLTAAGVLQDHGFAVRVFDKARGPSGRMSTRRAGEARQFDHGAQFFTARDPVFQACVDAWRLAGVVAPWSGRFGTLRDGRFEANPSPVPRYVGVPRMSALGRHLAAELTLETGVRISQLEGGPGGWTLRDDQGGDRGTYDSVLLAVPAPQASPLLTEAPQLAQIAQAGDMVPCQALMLAFDRPLGLPFDGVEIAGGPLAWIARDSSKPGRPPGACWVVHADPDSSEVMLEASPEDAVAFLLSAFQEAVGTAQVPVHAVHHRWRFARPRAHRLPGRRAVYDPSLQLGLAGDWLVGARIEGAWQSGVSLARLVLQADPVQRPG